VRNRAKKVGHRTRAEEVEMRRWLWFNGLSLAMFGAFLIFIVLQSVFGWRVENEELARYGQPVLSYWSYLGTGHFGEAVFENWESEFLQMGCYVLLTAFLVQRGSPESKPPRQKDRLKDRPEHATNRSPKVSRRTDLVGMLYRNSLSIALLGLFALSFIAHALTGTAEYNEHQALESGKPPVGVLQFMVTSEFWFQSMQNWQSEFLAVGALIVLSIFLRQHGSSQSKPVTAIHAHTGE
jgi:hypothetical protein